MPKHGVVGPTGTLRQTGHGMGDRAFSATLATSSGHDLTFSDSGAGLDADGGDGGDGGGIDSDVCDVLFAFGEARTSICASASFDMRSASRGRVSRARSIPCRETAKQTWSGQLTTNRKNATYVAFGEDYTLEPHHRHHRWHCWHYCKSSSARGVLAGGGSFLRKVPPSPRPQRTARIAQPQPQRPVPQTLLALAFAPRSSWRGPFFSFHSPPLQTHRRLCRCRG